MLGYLDRLYNNRLSTEFLLFSLNNVHIAADPNMNEWFLPSSIVTLDPNRWEKQHTLL